MEFVFAPPAPVTLPVAGTAARLPVARLWCVGRNYADHAREMGSDPTREPPFFFAKSAHALAPADRPIPYPPMTADWHHEVEMVVALGRGGRDVAADDARRLVFGYAVGLDMTRRDLQAEAKRLARPWDMAKNHDAAAIVGAVAPASSVGHPGRGAIRLEVNGKTRQQGDLRDMIWPVAEIVAALSRFVELRPGDLLFTGTPAGVGPVARGDRLRATVERLPPLDVAIA